MTKPITTLDDLKIERERLSKKREEICKRNPLRDEDLSQIASLGDRLAENYWMIFHKEREA